MPEVKKCPECGGKIIGRADKKFCSDQCRLLHAGREVYREGKSIIEGTVDQAIQELGKRISR